MNISFKNFTNSDISLYYTWCEKPHVKEKWFRQGYEPKEAILDKINGDQKDVRPFVIEINEKPVGYIQSYKVGTTSWEALQDQPNGTAGFDIFIGEEDYVGKGYGNKVVKAFADKLLALSHINKIIVDPFADDARAIRCYEKAGFKFAFEAKDDKGTKIYVMEKTK